MDSVDSMCSAHGVLRDSMDSMSSTVHGVPMECLWTLWTPCAVLMDSMDSMCSAHGLLIDSM